MAREWNREFHNIGLTFEPQIVRVMNDESLCRMLEKHGRKHSQQIASHAHEYYRKKYGRKLLITQRSLACEIYGHYVIMKCAASMLSHRIAPRFASWLIRHMDVIDCGEKDTDNNRFVWDILSVFF